MKKRPSPFKFLNAYKQKDNKIFFGREAEIGTLYKMVYESNITLVYGKSGTGKTSLIQCGLANHIEGGDWLNVPIRHNGDINKSMEDGLKSLLKEPEEITDDILAAFIDDSESDAEEDANTFGNDRPSQQGEGEIVKLLNRVHSYYFKPVYLVFDQFEELFILGDSENEEPDFYANVAEILDKCPFCHMIVIMREEFLAQLQDFEVLVPGLFDKRLRIERLTGAKTMEVIERTVGAISFIEFDSADVTGAIADAISSGYRAMELTYLQVVLHALYDKAKPDDEGKIVFTKELVKNLGGLGDVLKEFLKNQTEKIQSEYSRTFSTDHKTLVTSILSQFVSLEGRSKRPMMLKNLKLDDVSEEELMFCIVALEKARILKRQDEDSDYFELAHDALASRIAAERSSVELEFLKIVRLISERVRDYVTTHTLLTAKEHKMIKAHMPALRKEPDLTEQHWLYIEKSRRRVTLFRWLSNAAGVAAIIGIASLFLFMQKTKFDEFQGLAVKALGDGDLDAALTWYEAADGNLWSMWADSDPQSSINELEIMREADIRIAGLESQADELHEKFNLNSDFKMLEKSRTLLEAYDIYNQALAVKPILPGRERNIENKQDKLSYVLLFIAEQLEENGTGLFRLDQPLGYKYAEEPLVQARTVYIKLGKNPADDLSDKIRKCKTQNKKI